MKVKDFFLNYIALFVLMVMTVDSLYANWKPDIVWNLLYARIQLNLFYNTHASSVLAICLAAWWMALKKKDGFPVAVFAAFGTASIHELSLDAVDLAVFHISSGISIGYAFFLFVFLGLGAFVFTKKYHKNVWALTTVLMFGWFLILTSLPHGSTIDPDVPFGASKDFYTWWVNLEETASWWIPAALWFLPRKWFEWKSQP